MSSFTQTHTDSDSDAGNTQDVTPGARRHEATGRRLSTETKASYKTTELIAYVVIVIGVLVASAQVDNGDFGAEKAWFFVSLLTIGYMISRGLAKSGSRESFNADSSPRGN